MFRVSRSQSHLQNVFWYKYPTFLKQSLLIVAGALVLAIASQLSVPLKPVPLTFQSATVILLGMGLGASRGSYAILVYLIAGIIGLPVFAGFSSGFAVLIGPTSGYLVGFLPAAYLSGYLAQRGWGAHIGSSFAAACLGTCIIFGLGLALLSQWVGWENAITVGLMPFLVSEPIKLIAVSLLVPKLWK